jgi:hypothetical protein
MIRAETIRKRFLNRLHRVMFQTVPNTAPAEIDLSKLRPAAPRKETLEFSIKFQLRDQPEIAPARRKP